jgi:hypothetical protein
MDFYEIIETPPKFPHPITFVKATAEGRAPRAYQNPLSRGKKCAKLLIYLKKLNLESGNRKI